MDDFQLQNEMTEATRRKLNLYLEKRNLQLEVEVQNRSIQKKSEKFLATWGALTAIFAVISYVSSGPFNFFFFFVFGFLSLGELFLMLVNLNRKKKNLEIWKETPREFLSPNEI